MHMIAAAAILCFFTLGNEIDRACASIAVVCVRTGVIIILSVHVRPPWRQVRHQDMLYTTP